MSDKSINIAVILSTYNGSRYIRDQIDSILRQKGVSVELFVRDDGSTDGTKQELERYSHLKNFHIVPSNGNMGYRNSFFTALNYALDFGFYPFFAFSDQDDVWMDNKLTNGINCLETTTNEYKLFYSSLQFVNSDLSLDRLKSYSKLKNTLPESFVRFSISGATFIFNFALAKQIFKSQNVFTLRGGHDTFLYRLNLALGGDVLYSDRSEILFRRHQNNASTGGTNYVKKLLVEFSKDNQHVDSEMARYLVTEYKENVSDDDKTILEYLSLRNKKLSNNLRLICDSRFRRESKIMNFVFYLKLLAGVF